MERNLIEKLWDDHQVIALEANKSLVYIDRIFLHERTGSVALKGLEEKKYKVINPEQVFCTMDHIIDTLPGRNDNTLMPSGKDFIVSTRKSSKNAGITLFDIGDDRQGIVHVVSAEQGITLPGLTQVCPDSHTCTLGALGALAWGIGSSEGEHALATKTLSVNRPMTMRVEFFGNLNKGVYAKDLILYLIGKYTASGGVGHAIEFTGPVINSLEQEGRFTICNMSVEFGAFTGLISPDDKTFNYLYNRPYVPKDQNWDIALEYWKKLKPDDAAVYDKDFTIDCSEIAPQITWGTSPAQVISVCDVIPDPSIAPDLSSRISWNKAMDYMGLEPGSSLEGLPIDAAFIGSCTNSRLSDLKEVAQMVCGRKVAEGVRAIVVPGSSLLKRKAEEEGIDTILKDSGFEWRESGCSMCFYAGGESFGRQERVISSTNRNFENRQGPNTRTHLASPISVAASALAGHIVDARRFI